MTLREVAKFSSVVALLAIFADASLGHGLLWENDPYWTYWITKTFLIATVFALGTAWVGAGVGRGAAITAVHTLVLTVYYWTVSPIGLPSHPHWLDLEHTWVTGVPVHFTVIYAGYLLALWLWRRGRDQAAPEPSRAARDALATGVLLVLVAGALSAVALEEFQGVTWYVVRLLITVPFVLVWWAYAGRSPVASVSGGVLLALMWATYGHFLGPNGLPDTPLRLFDQAPPPAAVAWLDYRELWLTSLPIYVVVAVGGMLLAAAVAAGARRPRLPGLAAAGVPALLIAPLLAGLALTDAHGDDAQLRSAGAAQIERGDWFSARFTPATASLRLAAEDRGGRATPLEPHDELEIAASVDHPTGSAVEVSVARPLVSDPLGRHGTWWGVGLDVWHHGESGIGTSALPDTHSDVAVFGSGEVRVDDRLVAAGVPVHVMTVDNREPRRLELHVGDEDTPVPGLPDDHLRIVWEDYAGGPDANPKWDSRHLVGSAVLLVVLGFLLALNRGGPLRPPRAPGRTAA